MNSTAKLRYGGYGGRMVFISFLNKKKRTNTMSINALHYLTFIKVWH